MNAKTVDKLIKDQNQNPDQFQNLTKCSLSVGLWLPKIDEIIHPRRLNKYIAIA